MLNPLFEQLVPAKGFVYPIYRTDLFEQSVYMEFTTQLTGSIINAARETVASCAKDVSDCRILLEALGLLSNCEINKFGRLAS